jgi:hypothetical protein
VIEHVDLQNPGSLGQPASQSDISFTRRRITGYAACGITGAMPYPFLRRTEDQITSGERLSGAA